MRINEEFIDNIDSQELATDEVKVETDVKVPTEDQFANFILFCQNDGLYIRKKLYKILMYARTHNYFTGDSFLYYHNNQREEMKPLLSADELTETSTIKLDYNGYMTSVIKLIHLLAPLKSCDCFKLYFKFADDGNNRLYKQVEFFQIPVFEKFEKFSYENPYMYLHDYINFERIYELICLMFPNDYKKQLEKFHKYIKYDPLNKFLQPYTFVSHIKNFDSTVTINLPNKLLEELSQVKIDPDILKMDWFKITKNRLYNRTGTGGLEATNTDLEEFISKTPDIYMKNIHIEYYKGRGAYDSQLIMYGYLGTDYFDKYIDPERIYDFTGGFYGCAKEFENFYYRCWNIFGQKLALKIQDAFGEIKQHIR